MVTSFSDCRINGKLLVNTFSLSPDNNNERSSVWNRFGISNQNDQNLINELKSLSSNQIRDIQSENACYYLFEISQSLLSQQDKIKNETLLIKYLKDLNFINIENNDINIKFSNVIPPMSIDSFRTILQNCNINVNINLLDNIYNKLEIHNPRKDTLSILINIISKNLKQLSKDDTLSILENIISKNLKELSKDDTISYSDLIKFQMKRGDIININEKYSNFQNHSILDWSITNELPIDFVRDILDCDSSKIEMLDKLNMKSEYIELLKDYPEIVSDQQKKIQTEQYIESLITLLSNKQESTRSLLVNFHQCLLNSLQSLFRLNEQLSTYNEGGVDIRNSIGGLIGSHFAAGIDLFAAEIIDQFPDGLGSIIGGIISIVDKKLRSKKAQNVMLHFRTQQSFSETAQLFSIRIMTFYRDIILDKNFSVKIPLISMSTLDDFQDYLFAKSGNKITISGYEENKNRWSFLITLFSDQFFETLFNLKNIDYNTHSPQFICDSICNIIIPKLSTSPFLPIQNNNNSSNQTRINTIKSQQYFEFAMLAYLQQQNFTIIVHNYIRKWFPNITESSFQSKCTIVNYSKVSTITIEHENQLYISIGVKESTIDKTKYLLIKNTNIDGTEIDSYFFSLFDFVWKDHLEKSIQQFYQNHRDGTLNIIGYSTGGSISSILHLNLLSKKETSSKKDKIYLWTFEEEQWTKSLTNYYNNNNNTMKIINSTVVTKELNRSKIIYYSISNNDNRSQFRDINEYQYIINDTKTTIKIFVNTNSNTKANINGQPTEDFQHPNKDELDMLFDRIFAKVGDKENMPVSEMGYISPAHYEYITNLPESNKAEWYNMVYMNQSLDHLNRDEGSLLNNIQKKDWEVNGCLCPYQAWELLRGSIQYGNIIMVKYLMPLSNQYMGYLYIEMVLGSIRWDTPFQAAIRYNQFDILEYLINSDQLFTKKENGEEIGQFIYQHKSQIRYMALRYALSENYLISKTLVDNWQSKFEDGDDIKMLFLRDHKQLIEYLSYKNENPIFSFKWKFNPIEPISEPKIEYTGNNVSNYTVSHYSLQLNLPQDTLYNILVEEIKNGNFKKFRELYESVFGQKSVILKYTKLYVYSLLKLNEKQLALQVCKQLKFDHSSLRTMMDSFYIIGLLLSSFKYYSKAQLIFELVWDQSAKLEPLVPHFPALFSLVNIYRKTGLIDKALAIAKGNQLRSSKESINQYAEQQFASIVFEIQQKIKAQQQEFKEKMKIEFHQQIQNLNFEPTNIFSNNDQLKPLFENSKINLPLKYATDYTFINPLSSLITNLEAVINKSNESKEIITIITKYQLESLRSHYSSYQLYKNQSSLFSKKINDKLIHFENLSNGSKGILNFGIYYDLYLDKATKDQIEFGSHSVKESKSSGLHFKKDPYSAGIEFAASQLQNLICESICPESNLIKIEREPGSFDYYLATKTIHGYNLANYSNDKNIINLIDHYNFSGLVISSFLTRPGDAKPDNFIIDIQLSPSDSSIIETVHLYGIDNDISFYNSTINSNKNRLHYHILNILYFFPQMNKPVHPTLIEKLTKKYQPEMILLEWIDKLLKQNELFNKLDDTTKDIYKLPIQFPERTITEVYRTLLQISNLIQLNPSILLNTIFHHLYPGISSWYQLFKQKGDNLESIRELYEQVVFEKKSDSSNIRQSSTQQKIQSISVSSKLVKKDVHTYKSSYNSPLSNEINKWISSIDFRKFNPSEKESQDFFDKFIQVFSGTSLFGENSVILSNIKNKQYDQLLKHTATKLPVENSISYSSNNNNNNNNNNNTKILGTKSSEQSTEKCVIKFVTEDIQVTDEKFPTLQKIDLEICLNSGCFGNLFDNHFKETLAKITKEIKGLIMDFKPEILWKFIRELKVDISVKIIRTMPMIYLTILMDNEAKIASTKKSILEYTIARPQLHLVSLELLKRILSIDDQEKIIQIIPERFNDNHDSIIHMIIDNHSDLSNSILNLLLQHPKYFKTIPHKNQQNIDIFKLSIEKQRYDITSLLLHSPDSKYKLSFKNRHGITSDYTITLILVSKYIVINSFTIGNENQANQELYNLFQSKRALLDKVTKSNDYKTFKIIWKFFKDDNEFINHFNENGYHKLASNTDIQLLSKVYQLLNQPINLKEIVSGQFNSIGLPNERRNTILYEFLKIYQNTQEFNRMLTAIIDYHNSHNLNIHKTDRIDQMTPLHFAIISNMKEAIERIIPP
ncbi:ankyrin repeat-containing protein [Tieghemostelium lacteum]|uniref:Ankyrin repeat-containing protein n=1 Tax=Tieghemostelium lacteum TaxID=361077 RepID=A0A151Z2W5_TIELA|nr:ankyrin repeat-containing protein [Tieghemostelium lacteum]|eukprot:KYQ88291.1 ankyrin repeat-containing protein [Tieghemostelium lacteum]